MTSTQATTRPDGGEPLADLDARAATALVTAAADVALVVDDAGVVCKVVHGSADPSLTVADGWVGKRWVDTVTPETRGKVEAVLRDAAAKGISSRRQVNHVANDGPDIPVAYTGVRVGGARTIAVGRDLRAVSTLQQRLVETQQALERDYWRLRHVETRYRLLFQRSAEAVLVVDAATRRVVDANAAAGQLFDVTADKLVGRAFPFGTSAADGQLLNDLLASTRTAGGGADVTVRVGNVGATRVSASSVRQDAATLFLVRFTPEHAPAAAASPVSTSTLDLIARMPDGFVVTDLAGNVLMANQAFLDIAQLSDEAHARGRPISEWIGRPGADLSMFLSVLKKHDAVRLMSTSARGEHGLATEVEVSAVAVEQGEQPCIGFVVRDVGRRVAQGAHGARDLTRAVEQLTELVGRVSLPELLRDTVELVERHFLEAALEMTNNNRTAAAEVLGLSRQSVYVKLRRHRLLAPEAAESVAEEAG